MINLFFIFYGRCLVSSKGIFGTASVHGPGFKADNQRNIESIRINRGYKIHLLSNGVPLGKNICRKFSRGVGPTEKDRKITIKDRKIALLSFYLLYLYHT